MVDAKSIYGTGSSSAHASYVTKWRTTYTQYSQSIVVSSPDPTLSISIEVHAEKMAFRRSDYFLKIVISCTAR